MYQVVLVSGKGLKANDIGGTSDPFALFTSYRHKTEFHNYSQTSPIKKKTINPTWNHGFKPEALIPHWGKLKFSIIVYDHEKIGKPKYLGEAEFELPEDYQHDQKLELTQELKAGEGFEKEKKITGSITVHVLINNPLLKYDGATFTMTGTPKSAKNAGISKWTGKGIIATRFSSGGITFEFSELSRHMDDGSVWTTDNISSITTDSISNKSFYAQKGVNWKEACEYIFQATKIKENEDLNGLELSVSEKSNANYSVNSSDDILNINRKLSNEVAANWKFDMVLKQ